MDGSKAVVQGLSLSGECIHVGLGGYTTTLLAEAIKIAAENKILATKGINPRSTKTQQAIIPSFKTVSEDFPEIKLKELITKKH